MSPQQLKAQIVAAACNATSHLLLSRRLQAYHAHRDLPALDRYSSCLHHSLHDGGNQQGPRPQGHCQLLAGHFPGGQLRPDEGITPVHHSPPVHSGLHTCLGKAPRGADSTSLATLPPSLSTLCRSWTGTDPRGTWDWVNCQPSSTCIRSTWHGESIFPLHLMPSPAQEHSQALTEWSAPPEATGHLKACASLQRELLPREPRVRSPQGFSASPAG